MEILTSQLPSGGYGYSFPSVTIKPMNFLEIVEYLENVPKDPLEKYLYDIKMLTFEDNRINDCYVMDLDFLIFYKKLITVSGDLIYEISVPCPECGSEVKKRIDLGKDVTFKQVDPAIMNGAIIELGGHKYDTQVPTVKDFLKVFEKYLRFRKVENLKLIKTISLIKNFELEANQIEKDVLEATHEDVTLLLALHEIYFDRIEPIDIPCPGCIDKKEEGRGIVTVRVDSLIVDFFRDIIKYSPINESKVLFK